MKRSKDKKNDLAQMIREAFEEERYPGHNKLILSIKGNPERKEIFNDFKGKHWKDISVKFLQYKHNSSIFFFTAEGFRFYLPAYMLASVEHYSDADTIPDYIINILTPSFYNNISNKIFYERIESMSVTQKIVVRLFLEFLRDEYHETSAGNAINEYWNQY